MDNGKSFIKAIVGASMKGISQTKLSPIDAQPKTTNRDSVNETIKREYIEKNTEKQIWGNVKGTSHLKCRNITKGNNNLGDEFYQVGQLKEKKMESTTTASTNAPSSGDRGKIGEVEKEEEKEDEQNGENNNGENNNDGHNNDGHNNDEHNNDGHNNDGHNNDGHNNDGHNNDEHNNDEHNSDRHNNDIENHPNGQCLPVRKYGTSVYKEKMCNENVYKKRRKSAENNNVIIILNLKKKYLKFSNNALKKYMNTFPQKNFRLMLHTIDNDIRKKKNIYNKELAEYNNFIYTVDCMFLQSWENEHELADNEKKLFLQKNKKLKEEGKELLKHVNNIINEANIAKCKMKKGVYASKIELYAMHKELKTIVEKVQQIEEKNYPSIFQQGEFRYFLKKTGFQKKCKDVEFYEFYEKKFLKSKENKKMYSSYWNKLKQLTDLKPKRLLKNCFSMLHSSGSISS